MSYEMFLTDEVQTWSMAFTVYTEDRRVYGEYGDDESFVILQGGALQVTRSDGARHYVSAAVWTTIDETPVASAYATQDPLVM